MAAPSVSWTDLDTLKPLVDHRSGLTTTLAGYLRDNTQWLMETLVNDTGYTGDLPHGHAADGNSGAAVQPFSSANLLLNGTLRDSVNWAWTLNNVDADTEVHIVYLKDATSTLSQGITNNNNLGETVAMFGGGADLVGSVFIRKADTTTAGSLTFGIADGASGVVVGPG